MDGSSNDLPGHLAESLISHARRELCSLTEPSGDRLSVVEIDGDMCTILATEPGSTRLGREERHAAVVFSIDRIEELARALDTWVQARRSA
ncbi:hypothetical protein D2E64_22580 [Mycobacteroides abscessus]|nr:hypothetical protein DDJ76_23225 [Mycobacteroides abscessus]RIS03981.1 hypothetical protein D2E63_22850 [Mycobacteroides abscessus]RIS23633.1 hypothetical protein D2E67_22495 [Mycobacteroides abscessus]RIT04145.1 hypothetical protein D2E64_22580 [Mycobacteroides abscessus]